MLATLMRTLGRVVYLPTTVGPSCRIRKAIPVSLLGTPPPEQSRYVQRPPNF